MSLCSIHATGVEAGFISPTIQNMGLDMYAHRKIYLQQSELDQPDERYTVQITKAGKPVEGIQPGRISVIEERVMYWRKANHIHAWFVNTVQEGVDECKEHFVDWDLLIELQEVCDQVIEASSLVDGEVIESIMYDEKNPNGVTHRVPGKVISDSTMARKLLPRREGLFFGSYEYNEEYLSEVIRTRDWLTAMLSDSENGVPGDIYYISSW